jgi:hypothetical protein
MSQSPPRTSTGEVCLDALLAALDARTCTCLQLPTWCCHVRNAVRRRLDWHRHRDFLEALRQPRDAGLDALIWALAERSCHCEQAHRYCRHVQRALTVALRNRRADRDPDEPLDGFASLDTFDGDMAYDGEPTAIVPQERDDGLPTAKERVLVARLVEMKAAGKLRSLHHREDARHA